MGLKYDFYQNPLPEWSNRKPRMHARVVTTGTIGTEDIARRIHDCSTLTPGEVKAVLQSLSDILVMELSEGHRVHLEGLGYFQLTLECPSVRTEKEIRSESIKIKSVVFRAEEKLKRRVRRFQVERVRVKNKSNNYSDIEIDGLLTGHFMDNDYITGRQFRSLCGFTLTTSSRRLRKLIDEGKLERLGHRKSSIYVPVKGNYRK